MLDINAAGGRKRMLQQLGAWQDQESQQIVLAARIHIQTAHNGSVLYSSICAAPGLCLVNQRQCSHCIMRLTDLHGNNPTETTGCLCSPMLYPDLHIPLQCVPL